MGNRFTGKKYSFADDYEVLGQDEQQKGFYQLRGRENQLRFMGRELKSADEEDIAEIEDIISEKLENPSPFVTPLLQQRAVSEDAYCSNTHRFFLLYAEPAQRLSQ